MVGVGWHVRYAVTVTLLGNASTTQGKVHKTPAAAIAKTLRFGLQIMDDLYAAGSWLNPAA
jgi:hypothetical protein